MSCWYCVTRDYVLHLIERQLDVLRQVLRDLPQVVFPVDVQEARHFCGVLVREDDPEVGVVVSDGVEDLDQAVCTLFLVERLVDSLGDWRSPQTTLGDDLVGDGLVEHDVPRVEHVADEDVFVFDELEVFGQLLRVLFPPLVAGVDNHDALGYLRDEFAA